MLIESKRMMLARSGSDMYVHITRLWSLREAPMRTTGSDGIYWTSGKLRMASFVSSSILT